VAVKLLIEILILGLSRTPQDVVVLALFHLLRNGFTIHLVLNQRSDEFVGTTPGGPTHIGDRKVMLDPWTGRSDPSRNNIVDQKTLSRP
jgi:hypothetical protein